MASLDRTNSTVSCDMRLGVPSWGGGPNAPHPPAELESAHHQAALQELMRAAGVLRLRFDLDFAEFHWNDGFEPYVTATVTAPASETLGGLQGLWCAALDSLPSDDFDELDDSWVQAVNDIEHAMGYKVAEMANRTLAGQGSPASVRPLPCEDVEVRQIRPDELETSIRLFVNDPKEWERSMANRVPRRIRR